MQKFDSYEQLVSTIQNPATANIKQQDFNRQRFDRAIRANQMRPQYLPIFHTLPGVAASVPYSADTDELKQDVIVFGAITDGENRRAKILKDLDALPLVRIGKDGGANLTLDAIAGESVTTTAEPSPSIFPNPYLLRAGEVLTLDIFQETNAAAKVQTVLLAARPLRSNADDAMLSAGDVETIKKEIDKRSAPETKFATSKVIFDGGGAAYAETPKSDEPLLLLGFRSTFADAMINFGFDTDSQFAKRHFPIWALASKKRTHGGMFLMMREALFIPPQQQLVFTLKNTIDGVKYAENGQLEMIYSTV